MSSIIRFPKGLSELRDAAGRIYTPDADRQATIPDNFILTALQAGCDMVKTHVADGTYSFDAITPGDVATMTIEDGRVTEITTVPEA